MAVERAKISILIAVIITAAGAASPFGVAKFGGWYWLYFFPTSFVIFAVFSRTPDTNLFGNAIFFVITIPSFLIFRFFDEVVAYLGVNETGALWVLLITLLGQGGLTCLSLGVFTRLYFGKIGFKRGTTRSLFFTYAFLALATFLLIRFLSRRPEKLFEPPVAAFIADNFLYVVLAVYTFFISLFLLTLTRHRVETIVLVHDIEPEVIRYNSLLLRYFIYPAIIPLIITTEILYRGNVVLLDFFVLAPLSGYLLYFIYASKLCSRYVDNPPPLKELVGEPGTIAAVFTIMGLLVSYIIIGVITAAASYG
jgi:hypothetical protein